MHLFWTEVDLTLNLNKHIGLSVPRNSCFNLFSLAALKPGRSFVSNLIPLTL